MWTLLLIQILHIACVNWQESYPYCPQATVEVSCSDDSLFLHWRVDELNVRATVKRDGGPVYTDSAAEFFCLLPDGRYANFEFNCLGYCLSEIQHYMGDPNRTRCTREKYDQISRSASLGRDSLGSIDGLTHWELQTAIPLHWLLPEDAWDEQGQLRTGTSVMCNFYLCADQSLSPHYVSWAPIHTPRPAFHKPEFFQPLQLR